jgi:hypothetical protein
MPTDWFAAFYFQRNLFIILENTEHQIFNNNKDCAFFVSILLQLVIIFCKNDI